MVQESATAPDKVADEAQKPTVFLIDDDPLMREYLVLLLKNAGHMVEAFASATDFLHSFDPVRPGCIISDIRMPGMGGLELQEYLASREIPTPIIIITGYGDVPLAMRAVRAGVMDFLEKPFDNQCLLDRIGQAIALDATTRQKNDRRQEILALLSLLTPREREVMEKLTTGKLNNKSIAAELNISRKTLDIHRASILRKMQCQSLVELTRKVQVISEET